MQTFINGLLLAAVSGVTVVAFRHPNGFARLFPYLLAIATTLFLGVTVWHIAVGVTSAALLPHVAQTALPAATDAMHRLRPSYPWAALWYIGVVAFLYVNLKLPPFLQLTDRHGEG